MIEKKTKQMTINLPLLNTLSYVRFAISLFLLDKDTIITDRMLFFKLNMCARVRERERETDTYA